MSANDLLQGLSEALYVLIFLVVGYQAVRQRRRAVIDMALFFGASAIIVVEGRLVQLLGLGADPLRNAINSSLLMALPYLLMRLVDDFFDVPRPLMRLAEAGLILSVLAIFLLQPLPLLATLLMVTYFVGLQLYAAWAFIRGAAQSRGVTHRRMQAVAVGSLFLGLNILTAGLQAGLPALAPQLRGLGILLGLLSGLAYYVGFAPPRWLRRAWQEPELRGFLGRAAQLPRLPDTPSILQELERGAATSVGAPNAAIGLWNEEGDVLEFTYDGETQPLPPGQWIVQRAFDTQRPIFSEDAQEENPQHAPAYDRYAAHAVLTAPITAGERRLGVLCVYAPHAPIFADSDLELVQLLADQAAVVLESRALIDEAARVRAREEVTRIKDDFLSAAAHDLKTPLTTILAQAQLLERQTRRNPSAPIDRQGLERIIREAKRLARLVRELLDASRVEQGRLLGAREPMDLVEVAREVCEGWTFEHHHCAIQADGPVEGEFDRARMMQLLENLIENAVKYSPDGGDVRIHVWREDGQAHLTVSDQGIGIASGDLPTLFERFQRGSNVDDRRFAGMGLGLFICRGIVEQHGGHIWATSQGVGHGSTFHVALPLLTGDLQHA